MDVNLKTWQKLFPELYTHDLRCACGLPSTDWKPFLHKDLAGLQADDCECGRSGVVVTQPRNKKANAKWMAALAGFGLDTKRVKK